ncbi:hypothetical protein [uncultured Desulfovibrio sp.]|uniref:Uncharacterized protein n=1 Tax=Candidatus Desulfovibrio intestinavium TaxID=2838534 RepID=A0A9D2HMS4_9BACT|nr:hypothetical protein [uncultured Desulfovibrio sp.]HJA78684.1 hypothetical protein [Candidatus Desulfovibrio intestinavium]
MLELKKLAEYALEATELLPLILLLTYPLGRRGHGRLAVWGIERLTRLCLWLCGASCGMLLLQAGLTAMRRAALPRGYGETLLVSLLACALAAAFLLLVQRANRSLPDFPPSQADEDCRYDGAVIRRPMLLLVPVLLCQFVLLQAQGGWFMPSFWDKMTGNSPGGDIQTALACLSAAGGVALLALHAHARTPLLSGRNWDRAVRWCAAWAVLGRLVLCLDIGLWKNGLIRPSMIMVALAACFWAMLICRPQRARRLWPVLLPLLCLILQARVQMLSLMSWLFF